MSVPDRAPMGCGAAIFAAAVIPVLPMPMLVVFSLPIAAFHAVILGIPLYTFMARRRTPGLARTLAGAFLVGALPTFILVNLNSPPPMHATGALLGGSESGSVLWAQLESWAVYLAAPTFFGACGMIGGLTFWLVVRGGSEV